VLYDIGGHSPSTHRREELQSMLCAEEGVHATKR
jgi:hypothetical protein